MKEFSDYEIEILTKEKFNFNNPNLSLIEKEMILVNWRKI